MNLFRTVCTIHNRLAYCALNLREINQELRHNMPNTHTDSLEILWRCETWYLWGRFELLLFHELQSRPNHLTWLQEVPFQKIQSRISSSAESVFRVSRIREVYRVCTHSAANAYRSGYRLLRINPSSFVPCARRKRIFLTEMSRDFRLISWWRICWTLGGHIS